MDLSHYPTDMDWMPGTKGAGDICAIAFANGSFQLVTKIGKVEKDVKDAHKGAVRVLDGCGNIRMTPSDVFCLRFRPPHHEIC